MEDEIMSETSSNYSTIASKFADLEDAEPDQQILNSMLKTAELINAQMPKGLVAGIDSSDNLLLNIPEHPGAAIAGYSFSLVISEPDGSIKYLRERMAEKDSLDYTEPLEIALVYSLPYPENRRLLRISEYQLRVLLYTPSTISPYDFNFPTPEYKVRLVAARHRETTERHAIRTALFQSQVPISLFLKDGRHSSQNVSARFSDYLGRKAVERGVRFVGVVKSGTVLWSILYPYHKLLYKSIKKPYWAIISPSLILQAYVTNQPEAKTLRLGAQENQSLGGVGGAWILYGNSPKNFFILEFNVYDLEEYKPLVEIGEPLEIYNYRKYGWKKTFVASEYDSDFIGTQTRISNKDTEKLIAPAVNEIHYLAQASRTSRGYPIVLADAHKRCKITGDRKKRENLRLIGELQKLGYSPVDFDTWSEDPHKIFEI